MRDPRLCLKDILQAMESIERFVEGMGSRDFEKDDKTSSAVIRKFEILGEATKGVPELVRAKYPAVPWREMAGMRDRLIHSYFGVKYDLVWRTVKDVIPELKPLITQILMDLEAEHHNHRAENG